MSVRTMPNNTHMNEFVGTVVEKDVYKRLSKMHHEMKKTRKYKKDNVQPLQTIYGFCVSSFLLPNCT
jgi:hypothetical protein